MKLQEAEIHSATLADANRKLHARLLRSHVTMQHAAFLPESTDLDYLTLQNEALRVENQHLRDLVRLAQYEFKDEIQMDHEHSAQLHPQSEASSFMLTTPPRSPISGLLIHRQQLRRNVSSASSIQTPPIRPPTVVIDEPIIDDIADVGPPMSPPNVQRVEPPRTINEAIDTREAQQISDEVDHDLGSE